MNGSMICVEIIPEKKKKKSYMCSFGADDERDEWTLFLGTCTRILPKFSLTNPKVDVTQII